MASVPLSADDLSKVAEWLRAFDALSASTDMDIGVEDGEVVLVDDGTPLVRIGYEVDGYRIMGVCG